jgi:hypothetical protein
MVELLLSENSDLKKINMYKIFVGCIFFSFLATATVPVNSELNAVLDSFHQAAGERS